jgi:hypothetical protein
VVEVSRVKNEERVERHRETVSPVEILRLGQRDVRRVNRDGLDGRRLDGCGTLYDRFEVVLFEIQFYHLEPPVGHGGERVRFRGTFASDKHRIHARGPPPYR